MIAVTVDEFGVWSAPRVTLSAAAAKLAGETEARSSGATVAEKLTLKLRGAKGGGCEGGGGVYPPSGGEIDEPIFIVVCGRLAARLDTHLVGAVDPDALFVADHGPYTRLLGLQPAATVLGKALSGAGGEGVPSRLGGEQAPVLLMGTVPDLPERPRVGEPSAPHPLAAPPLRRTEQHHGVLQEPDLLLDIGHLRSERRVEHDQLLRLEVLVRALLLNLPPCTLELFQGRFQGRHDGLFERDVDGPPR